jgi:hypothetical protein
VLKANDTTVRAYAVEPAECPLISEQRWGTHGVPGIGDGIIPRNLDLAAMDGIVTVSTAEALEMARRLAREEGLLCGPSSGMNVVAVRKVAAKHPELRRFVTVVPDTGQRYLSGELFGERIEVEETDRDHTPDPDILAQVAAHRDRLELSEDRAPGTDGDRGPRRCWKELSPVELLASVRARAETVEPTVNALTEQLADPADGAARESEERFQRGEGIRPLEGLPVAIKEEMPVEGWRMRYGSLAIDEVAEHTAPVPERIFAPARSHAHGIPNSAAPATRTPSCGVSRGTRNPGGGRRRVQRGSWASLASGTSTLASGSTSAVDPDPASINGWWG